MKLTTKLACTILALLAITTHAAQKSEPAKQMLEAAKKKEIVDGDLNAAIQQYKAIVDKFKNDRAVVAVALIHIAECYQKLGDAEAQKIYQRLLQDYADQQEAVTTARARLGGRPLQNAGMMAMRKVWSPVNVDSMGSVSP